MKKESKRIGSQMSQEQVKKLVLAGKAIITLRFPSRNGVHFTYLVRKSEQNPNLYFVSLLSVLTDIENMSLNLADLC